MRHKPGNGERGHSLLCRREALAGAGRRGRNLQAALSEKRKFTIVISTGTLLTLFIIDQVDEGKVRKPVEDERTDFRNYFELI